MEKINLAKWMSITLLLATFNGLSQNESFDDKLHKDTLLDKSMINSINIRGGGVRGAFSTNPLVNLNVSLSSSFIKGRGTHSQNKNYRKVILAKETGLPIFISTKDNLLRARSGSNQDLKVTCFDFLERISSIIQIENPTADFEIKSIGKDDIGKTHVKLTQKYKGFKVYASEIVVHFSQGNEVEVFNGNYHVVNKTLDINPIVTYNQAISNVVTDLSSKTTYRELTQKEKELLEYEEPILDTVIYEIKYPIREHLLVYHVSIHPNLLEHWDYFVDAKTGTIIDSYNNSCHMDGHRTAEAFDLNGVKRVLNTKQEGGEYGLVDISKEMYNQEDSSGQIITGDMGFSFGANKTYDVIVSSDNLWDNPIAVSAHYNAGVAYDYYYGVHGRNSIDGNGGDIISLINVVGEDGAALDNAYWNGKAIFYGNGNTDFKPLAGALDVAGHEMTHGVVESTARLTYRGESGAINESMSDIFGCMMDSTDWLIGEDIVKVGAFPSGALRSLSDPHNGGGKGSQPRHMNEKYIGEEDNGGVHINSGIPNWAFYKYAIALNSRNKASKVFYRALSVYLTASSQFIDLRIAVIQSAKDLFGEASNEVIEASRAFDAVGIIDGEGGVYTSSLPVNTGEEYLLSFDTDLNNVNGLYRSNPSATNFTALLDKSVGSKPSVTDDGETCVFVGVDKKIYGITANPSKPFKLVTLQDQAIWSNVAISKDGNRLAAVTYDKDTSIYVYDFEQEKWARFQLYNPTFTEGVKSGGVVYADAIEWSYDGESLVYDCFNSIKSGSGDNIEYWDINSIKVWEKESLDFSNGTIVKLFNNLDEGESIGNPIFSKNSPYVLAFDYFNQNTNTYAVVGLDIEKNDLDIIAVNNTVGWPSFNKTDDRIAFTNADELGSYNVNYVTLNTNKISSNGIQSRLIENAKWPVYYAVGKRGILTGDQELFEDKETLSYVYPNPTSGTLKLDISKVKNVNQYTLYDLSGTEVEQGEVDIDELNLSVKSGMYILSLLGRDEVYTQKIIIE